ncbi:hypothetical protein F4779DRAFT_641913 [Xylariaceae sp. FL0662B]|nr:hypothetical protein F4779DRAFT_641913 [Xylariaceae sp. FL0662B]
MNEPTSRTTCLSSEPHDTQIHDPILHYLGCIEYCERRTFFDLSSPLWQSEIELEATKRELNDNEMERATALVRHRVSHWSRACEIELGRIQHLRNALEADHHQTHFVEQVIRSGSNWRQSNAYRRGLEDVTKWRNLNGRPITQPCDEREDPIRRNSDGQYDPNEDSIAHIIQFEGTKPANEQEQGTRTPIVQDPFPNQTTSVKSLLNLAGVHNNLTTNLLSKDHLPQSMKYFHFPANNMTWAEHAITRYYGDEPPNYDGIRRAVRVTEKTSAYMMLRPEIWHGQQQGGPDPLKNDQGSKNIVLFMPYLYWETDRRRSKMSQIIDDEIGLADKSEKGKERMEREKRQSFRKSLHTPEKSSAQDHARSSQRPMPKKRRPSIKLADVLDGFISMPWYMNRDKHGRLRVRNPLGQYLMDCTRLYEAMSNYRDQRLLKAYLAADKPLHPRRTLNKAFLSTTSKNTEEKDRDQVVYRWSSPKTGDMHEFDPFENRWPTHDEYGIQDACETCASNIRRVPRTIMVDQLWMWVLDEKTIITCFPKRYGAQHDPTGIHESIRAKLQNAPDDRIRSIFDLALLILDECSNNLFEINTVPKTQDLKPRVFDAFEEAINNLKQSLAVASRRLWHWTQLIGGIQRGRNTSGLHTLLLLGIDPEGRIHREIEDVVDELEMMLEINRTHEEILKQFILHVESILVPNSRLITKRKQQEMSGGHGVLATTSQEVAGFKSSGRLETEAKKSGEDKSDWSMVTADEVVTRVKSRTEKLEELKRNAGRVSESVSKAPGVQMAVVLLTVSLTEMTNLLAMKQHEIALVQSWHSITQSEATNKQNTAIVMFTIVTIVFVPLSFMSSVFGMNAAEFSDDKWSLTDQFKYLFPISLGVTCVTIVAAFSQGIQTFFWSVYKTLTALILVKTGIYALWMKCETWAEELLSGAVFWADSMKDREKEKYLRQRNLKHNSQVLSVLQARENEEPEVERPIPGSSGPPMFGAIELSDMQETSRGTISPRQEENGPERMV